MHNSIHERDNLSSFEGNQPIVSLKDNGEAVTSSLIIAEGVGKNHATVIKLVRQNIADLEEFGLVGFQIQSRSPGQHGGGDVEYAILNEQQTTLLLTYMRNNDVVRAFKKQLVKAFYEMQSQQSGALIKRTDGISRMLSHKVTGLERSVDGMGQRFDNVEQNVESIGIAVIDLAERVRDMVITSDPRVAAVTAIPALQIAVEKGVKKRPRGLAQKISNSLSRFCESSKRYAVHRDIYNRKLFSREAVNEWLASGGWGPIKDTLDRKGGQSVLKLVTKE